MEKKIANWMEEEFRGIQLPSYSRYPLLDVPEIQDFYEEWRQDCRKKQEDAFNTPKVLRELP